MDPGDPLMRVPLEHWGCTNCHAAGEGLEGLVGKRPGPDLSRVGERLSATWMRRWIARPADLRGAPSMPRLFDESEADARDLDALVHFLAAQGTPAGGAVATEEETLDQGRELYHTLGCVACHGALESPSAVFHDEFLSKDVPAPFVLHAFGDLEGKWYPAALSAFLLAPGEVHRDGRMPAMGLSNAEADLIATYLLSRFGAARALNIVDEDQARRGAEVFAERGCQACHVIEGMEFDDHHAPTLEELAARGHGNAHGCLSPEEWDGPRYDFPAPALARMFQGVLMAALEARPEDVALDQLERRVYHLNCAACHELDGQGGAPVELRPYFTSLDEHADLGDEGRFPPHLNDVGAKLTTSWFEEVLQRGGRARPYIATRMPQYGLAAAGLPQLFARKHGVEPGSDAEWPPVDDSTVLLGRELMGPTAMACMNCHSYKDYEPTGTPGPDITRFAERLRYAWWNEYIKDPSAKKPGTRMPGFMNGGRAAFEQFAGGDFQAQTDALWAYFTLGEFMPAPEGVGRRQSLLLEVGDTPRVFRTYLHSAGTRGIAVGFPVGMSYAYDAKRARLVEVWRGAFLDASGAWAGRGGNATDAEGPLLWEAPPGPTLLVGSRPEAWPAVAGELDFQGYSRGGAEGPTFAYTLDGVEVHETVTLRAEPQAVMVRRLRFEGAPLRGPVWLRRGEGASAPETSGVQATPVELADGSSAWRLEFSAQDAPATLSYEVRL